MAGTGKESLGQCVKLSPGEMDNLDCIIMGRSVFVIDITIVFLNIFYLKIY
jgi:hypothetical protein